MRCSAGQRCCADSEGVALRVGVGGGGGGVGNKGRGQLKKTTHAARHDVGSPVVHREVVEHPEHVQDGGEGRARGHKALIAMQHLGRSFRAFVVVAGAGAQEEAAAEHVAHQLVHHGVLDELQEYSALVGQVADAVLAAGKFPAELAAEHALLRRDLGVEPGAAALQQVGAHRTLHDAHAILRQVVLRALEVGRRLRHGQYQRLVERHGVHVLAGRPRRHRLPLGRGERRQHVRPEPAQPAARAGRGRRHGLCRPAAHQQRAGLRKGSLTGGLEQRCPKMPCARALLVRLQDTGVQRRCKEPTSHPKLTGYWYE